MEKYLKPEIYRGVDAMYELSIALEVRADNMHPFCFDYDKIHIFEAAKLFHSYFRAQKFKGWL